MKRYLYIRSRDRKHFTRYLMYHCSIYDPDTDLCYHFTARSGYVCESLYKFRQENKIIKVTAFYSDKSIEDYYCRCAARNRPYNLITNNCESFANTFVGNREKSKQTECLLTLIFLKILSL